MNGMECCVEECRNVLLRIEWNRNQSYPLPSGGIAAQEASLEGRTSAECGEEKQVLK